MTRQWWIFSFLMMALAIYALPARADINPEPFESVDYVVGAPLSDVWDQIDDTTDVYTIEDVGPTNNKVVRFEMDAPNTGLPALDARYFGWGGPQRGAVGAKLWFSVDIEKGTAEGITSTSSNVWQLSYDRANDSNFYDLRGGLGTVQVRGNGGASTLAPTNLAPGWNRVVIMNDPTVNPNTTVWLNGVVLGTFNAAGNPANVNNNNNVKVDRMSFRQTPRGVEDYLVGYMRFDNVVTANEPLPLLIPEPTTLVLLGLGLVPATMLVRRRRKSA